MAPKQAQDTSAALSESYVEWLALGNVATREDVDRIEAKLEVKIEATKSEILKWMFAQTIALIGVLFGLLHGVVKL